MAAFMCAGAIKTRNLEAKFTLLLVMIAVKIGLNLGVFLKEEKATNSFPGLLSTLQPVHSLPYIMTAARPILRLKQTPI